MKNVKDLIEDLQKKEFCEIKSETHWHIRLKRHEKMRKAHILIDKSYTEFNNAISAIIAFQLGVSVDYLRKFVGEEIGIDEFVSKIIAENENEK